MALLRSRGQRRCRQLVEVQQPAQASRRDIATLTLSLEERRAMSGKLNIGVGLSVW
jgi:hypothetical protein